MGSVESLAFRTCRLWPLIKNYAYTLDIRFGLRRFVPWNLGRNFRSKIHQSPKTSEYSSIWQSVENTSYQRNVNVDANTEVGPDLKKQKWKPQNVAD